jgi:hypothetical protein
MKVKPKKSPDRIAGMALDRGIVFSQDAMER